MSEYTPDRWTIVRITSKEHPQIDKLVGSWFGGYGGSDSWRMNSGIVKIEEHDKHYDVYGYSGSVYTCYKGSEGWSSYTGRVIENMATQLEESGLGMMRVISIQEFLQKGEISYSTNWMGVANKDWYKNNGLTRRVTKVLEEDSELTGRKKGDVFEYDEITEEYSCGRIDVRGTGTPYGEELGVDPMRAEDWATFGNWLSTVRTDDVWTLEQLVEMYERTNPKIRWWEDKK